MVLSSSRVGSCCFGSDALRLDPYDPLRLDVERCSDMAQCPRRSAPQRFSESPPSHARASASFFDATRWPLSAAPCVVSTGTKYYEKTGAMLRFLPRRILPSLRYYTRSTPGKPARGVRNRSRVRRPVLRQILLMHDKHAPTHWTPSTRLTRLTRLDSTRLAVSEAALHLLQGRGPRLLPSGVRSATPLSTGRTDLASSCRHTRAGRARIPRLARPAPLTSPRHG